jgi:hypothetical protein
MTRVLGAARRSANAGFILAVGVTVVWQLQRNPTASKTAVNSYNEKHNTLRHQVDYDVAIVFGQALFRAWYD